MRKKRAKKPPVRKRRTVENDETCLQMHCVQWVKKTYPALLIFHVANERQAAVQYHVKLKRLGVLPGVADFLAFANNGRKFAIELKDDEGEQNVDQIKFQTRWERTGGAYIIVRTLQEFQSCIAVIQLFHSGAC